MINKARLASDEEHRAAADVALVHLDFYPGRSISSEELWQYFRQLGSAGKLRYVPKDVFLTSLRAVIQAFYGVKNCSDLQRGIFLVNGYRDIGIRSGTPLPRIIDLEP